MAEFIIINKRHIRVYETIDGKELYSDEWVDEDDVILFIDTEEEIELAKKELRDRKLYEALVYSATGREDADLENCVRTNFNLIAI